MGFNSKVILHITGILITMCLISFLAINTNYYATVITLSLILATQITFLVRWVNTTNYQLNRFLTAISHSDFSQSFRNIDIGDSFKKLGLAFDHTIDRLKRERSDQGTQVAYLHALIDQAPTGMLVLNETGDVILSNKAFRNLIDREDIKNINQVKAFSPILSKALTDVQPGIDCTAELSTDSKTQFLTISCSILHSRGLRQKMISIQNIQSTIDSQEMITWQNLTKVMNHEIMNSITPITSLSETAKHLVARAIQSSTGSNENLQQKNLLEDIGNAIETIGSRSQGLVRFVESYRTLSRLPTPNIQSFSVRPLLEAVHRLMQEQSSAASINISYCCNPENIVITADRELIEQALINVLINALESLNDNTEPRIQLSATLIEQRKVALEVNDNGCGMNQDTLDKLFIPFFTSKREGNGIGMTVVRQIVKLNQGFISVRSSPGVGTSVKLTFRGG